ncbi:hypothetical protein Tco_1020302 [Tanacetum coccineum]|uniref:Uncharacterized protein n=1 Tax=Tanacetum coccineum TaxID=301880 RepID=A0ABQ5FZQ5_9ASTR
MAAYQVPPSPDYIPGPEEPLSPLPLDFVLEPMYPKYIPQEDEILLDEEQPLPDATSPTANPPGYVPESDPEEELEDDNEDPEEDPADYPADKDDDDDKKEEEEPSRDDADDEDEDEDEDEEEEEEEEEGEQPAPANSVPPVYRMTARISIWDEPFISLPPREDVERLLTLTTPPPSPLTPLSSPLPHIPSPRLLASPPASPIRPLGYRAAMIWLRAETPSTSHLLPLPTSSPSLHLLSSNHRTDRPEITLPPRKRLGINLGPRYEIGESSAAAATRLIRGRRADYWFVGTMDTKIRRQRAKEVGYGIRDGILRTGSTQIYQSVGTLVDDSQYHYKTARLLDQEALVSEAWGRSIEEADHRSQTVTLEILQADHMRQAEIAALRTFDRTRHEQLVQTLTLI